MMSKLKSISSSRSSTTRSLLSLLFVVLLAGSSSYFIPPCEAANSGSGGDYGIFSLPSSSNHSRNKHHHHRPRSHHSAANDDHLESGSGAGELPTEFELPNFGGGGGLISPILSNRGSSSRSPFEDLDHSGGRGVDDEDSPLYSGSGDHRIFDGDDDDEEESTSGSGDGPLITESVTHISAPMGTTTTPSPPLATTSESSISWNANNNNNQTEDGSGGGGWPSFQLTTVGYPHRTTTESSRSTTRRPPSTTPWSWGFSTTTRRHRWLPSTTTTTRSSIYRLGTIGSGGGGTKRTTPTPMSRRPPPPTTTEEPRKKGQHTKKPSSVDFEKPKSTRRPGFKVNIDNRVPEFGVPRWSPTTTTTTKRPTMLTPQTRRPYDVDLDLDLNYDLEEEQEKHEDDQNSLGNDVSILGRKQEVGHTSFFAQPGMLAAVIGGAVVGLLCAILLVMYIVYRMRKKDEVNYALDEPKMAPLFPTTRGGEFYA